MENKWVIMQELEDTDCAIPYLIVDTEERADDMCTDLEQKNPGFIYWYVSCYEE